MLIRKDVTSPVIDFFDKIHINSLHDIFEKNPFQIFLYLTNCNVGRSEYFLFIYFSSGSLEQIRACVRIDIHVFPQSNTKSNTLLSWNISDMIYENGTKTFNIFPSLSYSSKFLNYNDGLKLSEYCIETTYITNTYHFSIFFSSIDSSQVISFIASVSSPFSPRAIYQYYSAPVGPVSAMIYSDELCVTLVW